MGRAQMIDENFFESWSSDVAYVVGYIAADGNINVHKNGGRYLNFQSADRQLIQDIRKVLGSDHHIGIRPDKHPRATKYRLQIGNKKICADLDRIGLRERKTHHLPPPSVPEKFFSDFVRGYFDGDGNIWFGKIHKDRRTSHVTLLTAFTSCSHKFLFILQKRLARTLGSKGSLVTLSKNRPHPSTPLT